MALVAGARLGPYEILAPIGAGGMGEVYRARDSRLDREVAIKVLPEPLAKDPAALARFESEAKAIAALSHPNILAIHDFGSDRGIFYVVTELLEGETLRSRLQTGALAWRKAAEMGAAIGEGLAAAHSKGITHRDLKPENVFLTSDGRLKILDFGLALRRDQSDASSGATTETDAGAMLGTVGYMSPEQVRGVPAHPPSDIFSLGCVLYEMATGSRAFQRSTPAETLAAVLRDEPADARKVTPGLPPELERVIKRCLEKNPWERFQSARDLAHRLHELLTGAREAPVESLAVLPFANAGGDPDAEYFSEGITETIINNLSRLGRLKVAARSTVFRYKGKEIDPQTAGRELNVRTVLTGKVGQRGGQLRIQTELVNAADGSQLWGQRYNRQVADVFAIEEEIATEICEALSLQLTGEEQKALAKRHTGNSEAYQAYLKGRYYWNRRSPDDLRQATESFQRSIAVDPNYALGYAGLADCYAVSVFWREAPPVQYGARAKTAAERAVALDERLAEAHTALAYVKFLCEWSWPEAEREFRRAIQLDPSYAPAYGWHAVFLASMNRIPEALSSVQRELELEPLSLISHIFMGQVLQFARRYDEAISEYRQIIEMDAHYFPVHWFLGIAYELKGSMDDAIREFEAGVALSGSALLARASLGRAYAVAGRTSEAEKVLQELIDLSAQSYVSACDVALIHSALGRNDEAFAWLDRAYQERNSWLAYLRADPRADSLRSDPRFADLLRRIGVPGPVGSAPAIR